MNAGLPHHYLWGNDKVTVKCTATNMKYINVCKRVRVCVRVRVRIRVWIIMGICNPNVLQEYHSKLTQNDDSHIYNVQDQLKVSSFNPFQRRAYVVLTSWQLW